MKYRLLLGLLSAVLVILFAGCNAKVHNGVSFTNKSMGDVYVNFRGGIIAVPSGTTKTVDEIPQGTYNYNTTYAVPTGASGSSAQGAVTGDLTFQAGTHIQILYSSTMINGNYILYATVSSSDDVNGTTTGP
jgi:hypothetical protein